MKPTWAVPGLFFVVQSDLRSVVYSFFLTLDRLSKDVEFSCRNFLNFQLETVIVESFP